MSAHAPNPPVPTTPGPFTRIKATRTRATRIKATQAVPTHAKAARDGMRRTLWGGLGLALGLSAFLNVAVLVVPIYDMQLYDRVLQSRNMDTMTVLSVACMAGLLLYAALDWLRGACFVALAEGLGRHLNGVVLQEGVRRAAAGDRQAGPELVRDLATLQGFMSSGAVAVPLDALCAPLGLALLFMLHPAFGWLASTGISVLVLSGLAAERLVRPGLVAAQARQATAGQALARSLADPELTEGLGMLPALGRRWAVRHGAALAGLDRAGRTALTVAAVSRLLRLALQAGITIIGALLVVGGASTAGSLMGANLLTARVLSPFDQIVGSWRQWSLAHAAWRRIEGVLADAASAAPPVPAADAVPGLLVRDAAVHGHGGAVLLSGVSLLVPPGMLVAVTGPNGAGKTTLLRLLAGLAPPDAGMVLLDGRPTCDPSGPGVGFLPQGVSLLDGTVAENIGRFRPGPMEGAVAAARQAGVHEIVGRMARGYDTALAGNGAALSGGMKQRVGLARALLGGPRLLVLDEPDASLDADGTAALLLALRACCDAGAIAVVTSHRPALRAAADLVVAVKDGTAALAAPPADVPRRATA